MMKKHDNNQFEHEVFILYTEEDKSCFLITFTSQCTLNVIPVAQSELLEDSSSKHEHLIIDEET